VSQLSKYSITLSINYKFKESLVDSQIWTLKIHTVLSGSMRFHKENVGNRHLTTPYHFVGTSHIEHLTELLMALLTATTLCW
jgi:hypothetical protein